MMIAVGKRIPWDEAFGFYLSLGPERSAGKVAKKFAVSETAVRKHAKANGWAERARDFDDAAAREAEHMGIRPRAERIADQIKVTDAARIRYAQQLGDPNYKVSGSELAALARHESLLEGEATHRVERADLDREL
jgi:hypothetical protein